MQEEESSPMNDGSYDANDDSQVSPSMEQSGEASVEPSMEVADHYLFLLSIFILWEFFSFFDIRV